MCTHLSSSSSRHCYFGSLHWWREKDASKPHNPMLILRINKELKLLFSPVAKAIYWWTLVVYCLLVQNPSKSSHLHCLCFCYYLPDDLANKLSIWREWSFCNFFIFLIHMEANMWNFVLLAGYICCILGNNGQKQNQRWLPDIFRSHWPNSAAMRIDAV